MILNQQLPEIEIGNDTFIVDLRRFELRDKENHSNRMALRDMEVVSDGFEFLYDPISKNVFKGSEKELSARLDVRQVKLPPRKQLDPELWRENFEPPGPYLELKLKDVKPAGEVKQKGRRR